ncbi:glycosyltransferase [bacterium 1xD8-6]|nr:glycosyltransferase [bacterium D16-36]RKI68264.1 glycosyltransferase [bacterium 1xD8-6]
MERFMKMVSVIMPAYNAEHFIEDAILSVCNQSYTDWNMYIYNDGSTDHTKDVIQKYTGKYPDKIYLIDGMVNKGTVIGLNTLLDAADGKYICWLSADDVYTEDMLEDSLEFLESRKEFDLVFSDYETIDENGEFLRSSPFRRYREELKQGAGYQPYKTLLTEGCCIHGCTIFARRECFDENRFRAAYRYAHDYDLWLRIAAEFPVGYIDKIHVQGREYKTQISMQGHNELDAVKVLFDFIQDREKFLKLYKKAGIQSRNEALREVAAGQLRTYKHREKELEYLLELLSGDGIEMFRRFMGQPENQDIFRVVQALKGQVWNQGESFFIEDSEDGYLQMLCRLSGADAVLLNKQAIRFHCFDGNTLKRFNAGLVRSNDIITGDVEAERLYEWLGVKGEGYHFRMISERKNKVRLAITYYLYMNTALAEELGLDNIYDTKSDIWWKLICGIYAVPCGEN